MNILHLTSGDYAGELLRKAGLPGEILVWRDILYDGVRPASWPDESALLRRAEFLEQETGGGVPREQALQTLRLQYRRLAAAVADEIILWFDACLFDQAMLAHLLCCLCERGMTRAQLICVSEFPGVSPFHGLGQLTPEQLAFCYETRSPLTQEQFSFAAVAEAAFASQNPVLLQNISGRVGAPLPFLPAAADRWLCEFPDPDTGCGRLEELTLAAVGNGARTPKEVFHAVAEAECPPQYWGDTTLWGRINRMADRGLLRVEGPAQRLPQWGAMPEGFRVLPA